jgi:hypothetical protein
MSVRVTKDFRWTPDGVRTQTVRAGDVVEGRAAEVALEMGCGVVEGEKAKPAAPENKAMPYAPRNKAR